ncbi:MAG: hypothetical protein KDB61_07540 [Planctomycetes bacterium]|nr:hypothetical protein [Planctomycetota bacterium]
MESHERERQSADITRLAFQWGKLQSARWDLHYQERADPGLRDSKSHLDARARVGRRLDKLRAEIGFFGEDGALTGMHSDFRKLEFAIAFLEANPVYFNSGYSKADLLTKLKACRLSQEQIARLNAVLLDAATNRPGREYVHYCRLAACIGDSELYEALALLVDQGGSIASRARMMRTSIENHGCLADPRNSNYVGPAPA